MLQQQDLEALDTASSALWPLWSQIDWATEDAAAATAGLSHTASPSGPPKAEAASVASGRARADSKPAPHTLGARRQRRPAPPQQPLGVRTNRGAQSGGGRTGKRHPPLPDAARSSKSSGPRLRKKATGGGSKKQRAPAVERVQRDEFELAIDDLKARVLQLSSQLGSGGDIEVPPPSSSSLSPPPAATWDRQPAAAKPRTRRRRRARSVSPAPRSSSSASPPQVTRRGGRARSVSPAPRADIRHRHHARGGGGGGGGGAAARRGAAAATTPSRLRGGVGSTLPRAGAHADPRG
eukprot:COSAG01_NODE_3161_length_6481_cov_89.230962_8_plen_294_part_00